MRTFKNTLHTKTQLLALIIRLYITKRLGTTTTASQGLPSISRVTSDRLITRNLQAANFNSKTTQTR